MIDLILGIGGIVVATWGLQVLTNRPTMGKDARCHECGYLVPNEPECAICGASRPDWFEYFADAGWSEWVRFNVSNPDLAFRGDAAERFEEWSA